MPDLSQLAIKKRGYIPKIFLPISDNTGSSELYFSSASLIFRIFDLSGSFLDISPFNESR